MQLARLLSTGFQIITLLASTADLTIVSYTLETFGFSTTDVDALWSNLTSPKSHIHDLYESHKIDIFARAAQANPTRAERYQFSAILYRVRRVENRNTF